MRRTGRTSTGVAIDVTVLANETTGRASADVVIDAAFLVSLPANT
ncbi:hypothetical protein [Oceanobacillus halotolerans]|nr:hypothetical protein [Oceanobacillus halotolerans]